MARATTKTRKETRDVTPLYMRADVERVNEDERTIDVIWTTGARVLRRNWIDGEFYEELSLDPKHVRLDRLNGGAPFLDTHNAFELDAVLGVVESGSAEIRGKRGLATIRFPKAGLDERADKILQKMQDKIIRNISVGYRVYKTEKTEEVGKIPVMRAVDWEPFEISAVSMGADPGAQARGGQEPTKNVCEFITRTAGKEVSTMATKHANRSTEIEDDPETPEAETPANDETATRAAADKATKDERSRITEIDKICRSAGLDEAARSGFINSDKTIDAIRKEVLDKMAEKTDGRGITPHHSTVTVTDDEREKFTRGATNALIVVAGLQNDVRAAAKLTGEKIDLDPGEFRGLRLSDLARMSLENAGVNTRRMSREQWIAAALGRAREWDANFRIAQGRDDFPIALENVMHKALQASYTLQPDTWSRFCNIGSVTDFRPHYRYRTGWLSALDDLNEHGEFKNKALSDAEKVSVSIATKGNIVALTRHMIINDDMSAFSDVATKLGRAAKLTIEKAPYALLALNSGLGPTLDDNNPLYDAAHNNLGTGAAISMASIDADRVVMMSQTDPSGNELLDLRPAILLLAAGLGGTARTINEAIYDPDTTGKLQKPNMSRGVYRDIIDTARLTGTRCYSFAEPNVAPVFEVSFLNGVQEPFADSQEGWRVDGVEWKVRLDFGVNVVDYRGTVTNAGQ